MNSMPAAMGAVFRGFFQEYSVVRAKWRLYERLFATPESIELLNRHGAHAFGLIEDILSAMGEILEGLQAYYSGVAELHEDVAQPGDFDELVGHLRELETLRAKSHD